MSRSTLNCLRKRKPKIESAAAKLKVVGGPEMANKVRKAIVKDRREVSPGKGDQGSKPSRVCRHDEGKAGRESKR
jgi:hypothetical protein